MLMVMMMIVIIIVIQLSAGCCYVKDMGWKDVQQVITKLQNQNLFENVCLLDPEEEGRKT